MTRSAYRAARTRRRGDPGVGKRAGRDGAISRSQQKGISLMNVHRSRFAALVLIIIFLFAGQTQQAQGQLQYRELRQLGKGSAYTVTWNPGATMFATGGEGGIWLYNASTFKPVKHLTDEETTNLIWLRDGKRIAADGPDGAT